MKIVKIQGGLGNQMFQYAFSKSLEKHGHQVFLDTSLYKKAIIRDGINYTHNGFELENVFSIKYLEAPSYLVKKLATLPKNIISRLKRKYLTKKTHYIDKFFRYTPEILTQTKDTYLEGYWQTEKYFTGIEKDIRDTFQFNNVVSKKTKNAIELIKNNSVCSIHVRRGDYLNEKAHAVCTEIYFNNAIRHVLQANTITHFFVFSNDIAWAKENLNFQNIQTMFVDWNIGTDSWQDMYIMSKCQINIIANSSFSWWAAWLNEHKAKRVIAPSVWNKRELDYKDNYYKFDFSEIVPDTWERISI